MSRIYITDNFNFFYHLPLINRTISNNILFLYLAVLSSNIASLHCKEDKLVFSVIWKLNKNAEILETKFYKGIMNSKAAMTYADAQALLNSKTAKDEIAMSLKNLSYLAQILRKRRFDNGYVRFINLW